MKLTYKNKGSSYAEEGQPNPIRWCLVSKTEDGFQNESNWLRCKDFFNDLCIAYNGGIRFTIYGFNTKEMTIPEKGQPVLLAVKELTTHFSNNLEVFNVWLQERGHPCVEATPFVGEGVNGLVLAIPEVFFSNTHHVSLITLIIRLLNATQSFSSFEEVIVYKQFPNQDQTKWNQVVKRGGFFTLPESVKDHVWYTSKTCNDKTFDPLSYSYSNLVHNNGVLAWINAMIQEEKATA